METPPASADAVDNAYANLTINSHELDPREMIAIVGIEPHEQWRIGDKRARGPEAEDSVSRIQGIQFRSRIHESVAADEHLYDLLDIREHKTALVPLTEHDAVESALLGLWSFSTYGSQNFSLSPADLELLADVDVGLWLFCSWNTDAPDKWRGGNFTRESSRPG